MTVDGNEACSNTAYMFSEVAGIYPITPASPMAEHIDEWSANGRKNLFDDEVKVMEMQSEAGAAGMVHGSLQGGCLTTTFTASQGLLLMIPNMYKIAGELLPGVIHVAARSIATHALSIFGDHQDIYATRMTGFAMLASSSVQQASDLAGIAHLSAIKGSVPFLHFFDGFRTSHEIDKIETLEQDEWAKLVDWEKIDDFRNKALNPQAPVTKGTAQNDDIYFQATEIRNSYYDKIPDIVNEYMKSVNKLTGRNYKPFVYYGDPKAESIIVAMGSVCETIKSTIDYLNQHGKKYGMIEVHLYRPFSRQYLLEVLPKTVQRIAVLDRTKEPGSSGEPLYLDVVNVISKENPGIEIIGGRYGLSSKDVNPADMKAVYDFLESVNHFNGFTVGIEDDVTKRSIPVDQSFQIDRFDEELVIYGYGSDGMVSASKTLMKLIGDNTDSYVQGYFQYDSKKSGGVTRSHLRFNQTEIHAPYYVMHPNLVVVSKEKYLKEFDVITRIKPHGKFLLNTGLPTEEVFKHLSAKEKNYLRENEIEFYIIDAHALARKVGLNNKISTIMEMAILKINPMMEYNRAKQQIKSYIKDRYFKKGKDILDANYQALDEMEHYLRRIEYDLKEHKEEPEKTSENIVQTINQLRGNDIPVSAFLETPDGRFEAGTSALEKRCASDFVPTWLPSNCIQCHQCSLVCPHGVIRPFLLSEEELEHAPKQIKDRANIAIGKDMDGLKHMISISIEDCTGCGLCVGICPGKAGNKALSMGTLEEALDRKENETFQYLLEHTEPKNKVPIKTVKGSQLVQPKFAFSGACAGCGETPYLKLLTQLFGDRMIIANATGCSSIYGASVPSMPYTVPWANSLFEDNAEFGYGILTATNTIRNRIKKIMEQYPEDPLLTQWLENPEDPERTKMVYEQLDDKKYPALRSLKAYIQPRSIWTIGGDGWAYDIGYGGLDHVLASNDNANILVLDSQVYSNTGGQSSKASEVGSIAAFTSSGKKNSKKDLARIAMSYPNCYVAQINLGANPAQAIKAMLEAEAHQGPSIILAYSPCISHGIKGGMTNSIEEEKKATLCGYWPLFRYVPAESQFYLDSKTPNFDLYKDFLENETRYAMLKIINPEKAEELLKQNKEEAITRFQYYQNLQPRKRDE